jgi:hypothetical protein
MKILKYLFKKNFRINSITEFLFIILIFFTLIGSILIFNEISDFIEKLRQFNPNYKFPKIKYFYLSLITIIILFIKFNFELYFQNHTENFLESKYFTEEFKYLKPIAQKKLASNFFKLFYYGNLTIFSYFVLKKCDYFPKELGGNGYMSKLFEIGYPNSFFHYKPKFFNINYLINLSYTFVELIYLLFLQDQQTDFFNMLFHHICTISLITFSYISNYSHVGSLVLFLHNSSDFAVYLSRVVLYVKTNKITKILCGLNLLLCFIYMRMFILGKIIYVIYFYITWKWEWVTRSLWGFLIFLYIMHFNWTIRIIAISFNSFYGNYSDSCNFKVEKKE